MVSGNYALSWALLAALLSLGGRGAYGFGRFGFDIHHRFSDPVKGVLDVDDLELPEKGSVPYYAAMAHRDRAIHGRRLAGDPDAAALTFSPGNETYRLNSLGFLHYANVTVGTPGLWFLVALDTGSDLFWLPCDCSSCVTALRTSTGKKLELNIFSPNTSSTSSNLPCNSSLCAAQSRCPSALSTCPYQVIYLSNGTSSTGVLVEDVLHLVTDDDQTKDVDAQITLGCGQVETGSFLKGAAPNGLFGLGMRNISVPSRLAKEGIAANSFSMCFSPDGMGRISFGDKGSTDQGETPFNLQQPHPTYNVTVTQISTGGNNQDLEFTAIFDSGTSFTYLNDPVYTLITQSFDSLAQDKQVSDSTLPFEYCYALSSSQTGYNYPMINLTMKGGDQFYVSDPTELVQNEDGSFIYCLALVKSGDVNIIGQNFMTGYRIIFDREKMVLGWKASDCYNSTNSTMMNIPKTTNTSAVPPAVAVNPQATSGGGSSSGAPSNASNGLWFVSCYSFILMILFSFFITI